MPGILNICKIIAFGVLLMELCVLFMGLNLVYFQGAWVEAQDKKHFLFYPDQDSHVPSTTTYRKGK